MAHPGELISRAGAALTAGRLDAMAAACSFPCVVALSGIQHVLRDREEMIEVLRVFRDDMFGGGVVRAETTLESQVIFNDNLAFLNARTAYFDAEGTEVTESRLSYVLRQAGERWEVLTLSIDKKARHSPGACLLEERAA